MRTAALVLLLSLPAAAGQIGAQDDQAAPPTGYPGRYLRTVALSLSADKSYGTRLLDALFLQLKSVAVMTSPQSVADYLEGEIGGGDGLDRAGAALGEQRLLPSRCSALLLAEALVRPDQLREVLVRMESLQRGLGRHAARLLRRAHGAGDERLIMALREAGEEQPDPEVPGYPLDGRFDALFADAPPPSAPGSGGRPRAADAFRPR